MRVLLLALAAWLAGTADAQLPRDPFCDENASVACKAERRAAVARAYGLSTAKEIAAEGEVEAVRIWSDGALSGALPALSFTHRSGRRPRLEIRTFLRREAGSPIITATFAPPPSAWDRVLAAARGFDAPLSTAWRAKREAIVCTDGSVDTVEVIDASGVHAATAGSCLDPPATVVVERIYRLAVQLVPQCRAIDKASLTDWPPLILDACARLQGEAVAAAGALNAFYAAAFSEGPSLAKARDNPKLVGGASCADGRLDWSGQPAAVGREAVREAYLERIAVLQEVSLEADEFHGVSTSRVEITGRAFHFPKDSGAVAVADMRQTWVRQGAGWCVAATTVGPFRRLSE